MEQTVSLTELQPGQPFNSLTLLKSNAEQKEGATGPFVLMTLKDAFGNERRAKQFQSTSTEREAIFSSRFLCVSGSVERGKYSGELKLTSVQSAEEPDDIARYLPALPPNHAEIKVRFRNLLKSVHEPNLHQLLRVIFDNRQNTWTGFCSAYAAQKMHHAYRGGLLEHSLEVAELCESVCRTMPRLRRDFLITCALLHDIGKLDEMDHGLAAGEYTDAGVLTGHTVSGAYRIRQAADSIPGFPPNLKCVLMHLILSHHGLPEYGAAKVPSCAEAYVLSQCDLMSARVYECNTAAETAVEGQISVRLPGWNNGCVYVGNFGLQDNPRENTLPAPAMSFVTQVSDMWADIPSFTTTMRVLGLVAAGDPEQSSEEAEENRNVTLPPAGADYLLRVTGQSMIGAGIHEGDLLFVRHQEIANDQDIVIAHIPSEGQVVKRLRRAATDDAGTGGKVWLESENPDPNYKPIPFDENARIQGKVTGLLRDF